MKSKYDKCNIYLLKFNEYLARLKLHFPENVIIYTISKILPK